MTENQRAPRKPKALAAGSRIGVFAPASPAAAVDMIEAPFPAPNGDPLPQRLQGPSCRSANSASLKLSWPEQVRPCGRDGGDDCAVGISRRPLAYGSSVPR